MSEQDEAQRREVIRENATDNHNRPCPGHLVTAPAGSEDAGLAQMGSIPAWLRLCQRPMRGFYGAETTCARPAAHPGDHYPSFTGEWPEEVQQAVAACVEAARAEERERIGTEVHVAMEEAMVGRLNDPGDWQRGARCMRVAAKRVIDPDFMDARIAQTPPPARDARGPQEARNGPVGAEDAGDGRGHGRDDKSGRGAGL